MSPRARRSLLTVLASILSSGLLLGTPASAAPRAPASFRFSGGGFGHGIGMSQYGAYGMALAGKSAGDILRFYYGGASVGPVSLPARIRVGLLQHATSVTMAPVAAPGHAAGSIVVSGRNTRGGITTRSFPAGAGYSARPLAGGVGMYRAGRLVFGPTVARHALIVAYADGARPAVVGLPQTGRSLRWGTLEIGAVGSGSGARVRAVATMGFDRYLAGLGEVPSLWPMQALRAQAIAARTYALSSVRATGQYKGRASATGCSCAVYSDTRDQNYVGWSKETGTGGSRWVQAVTSTSGIGVSWHGALVKTFYSSSSGGWTASNSVWGSAPLPYYPARRDPYDAAGGGNPNHAWTVTRTSASVNGALGGYGVGGVTALKVTATDASGRAKTVLVTGTRRSVSLSGDAVRRAFGLKSTRFAVSAVA